MNTYREIVYFVLDEIKLLSDDSTILEEHIIYLANKYRAFLLKLKYADIKKEIPTSNYQSICVELELVSMSDDPCGGIYLRSKEIIPNLIPIGNAKVTPFDYYLGNIALISRERMRYVGFNKYLQNIIYCSLGPDNYLYFKSGNPLHVYLEKVRYTGVFEDAELATKLSCNSINNNCDILDLEFPLEDSLVSPLIEMIVKDLLGVAYRPSDSHNDANDDLSDIITWARRNMKSNLLKQIEG